MHIRPCYNYFLKSDADFRPGHGTWEFKTPYETRIPANYPSYMLECPYSVGDADKDGDIDKDDVNFIQRYLLGSVNIAETDRVYADANLDGSIDMSDAVTLIQQYRLY